MSRHFRPFFCALGLIIGSSAFAQTTFTWTGLGGNNDLSTPGNWLGGVAPSNNPGDDIVFPVYPGQHVALTSNLTIRNITFNGIQDGFWIDQGAGGSIFLHGNVTTTANSIYWGLFDRRVDLAAGNHIFTPNGSGQTGADLYFWGDLTGAGGITKNGTRTLIIGSDHATNTYAGGTVVNTGTLVVGAQNALGTGTVTLNNGTTLSASNYAGTPSIVLTNDFLFGSTVNFGGFASNDKVTLKLGDSSKTLAPISGVTTVNFTQTFGAQEVMIDGELINGASGATTYTFAGAGLYTLTGDNVHTGGTVVNSGASVVFQGSQSLPNSGLITGAPNSYVGLGTDLVAVDDFTDHINQASFAGTVGFDNAGIYSGDIDLSGFNNTSVTIGTKTSATMAGAITPVTGSAGYLFNGNGWLYLQDSVSSNPLTGNNVVSVTSGSDRPPMMVVVSPPPAGQNDYFGHTIVEGAGLIFDALDAHSPNSLMELHSGGYLGSTEVSGISSLLPSVVAVGTHTADSVIGFDSHDVVNQLSSPSTRTVTNLDLSGITGSIYAGTASKAILTGTVTTTDGGNGNYYFTGYAGGTLQVDAFLTGTKQVHIGLPGVFQDPNEASAYSNVELNDISNNYSGGTVLHSGYLRLSDPGVIGSGALTVNATASDMTAALDVTGTLANAINIQSGTLFLNSSSALTMTGALTGSGILHVNNPGVTLAGDSNFSGILEIDLQDTVTIGHNNALKGAAINLTRSGTLLFTTSAPEIGSLIAGTANGAEAELKLNGGSSTVLTIDQSQDGSFDGAIVESASLGSVVKTGGATLTLGGHTNAGATIYSGGTTITDGKLIAGTAGALGTGPITLNGGGVGSVAGVTLTNPITFGANGGTLAGSGIIGSHITAGTNVRIAPGNSPGTLTFAAGLTLAPAGTLDFEVQSAAGAAGVGYDTVAVTGGLLDITATPANKYTLHVISLNLSGTAGAVSDFNSSGSYSWLLFTGNTGGGGIGGFVADKFNIDLTDFANSLGAGSFSLVQGLNGSDPAIYLNFSPVPEPSTYALVASGLGVLWLARRRRR